MIKNKNVIFLVTLSLFTIPSMHAEDLQAKKLALEIIASLSDDLATLVINKHSAKDPQVTKTCCVRLISNLADAIATVIIKIKSNKEMRGVELCDEQEYQNALANITDKLMSEMDKSEQVSV